MKNITKKTVTLFWALLVISCSKVNSLQKDTQNLDKTASNMSYTAEDIKQIANSLYPQLRSGNSINIRNDEWEILTDKEKGLGEKMVAAGIYFESLEYQFWTSNNSDNANVLALMYRDAVDEFQGRMYDLYRKVDVKDMTPLKEGKRFNEELAFYALAFTMDRSHYSQLELARQYPTLKFENFQDIIRNVLKKEHDKAPVKRHEAILLSGLNREIIIELYRARVDILATVALRDLVDQRNMTIGDYSKAAVFMVTNGKLGSIEVPETYDSANMYTKMNVINYLKESLKAKEFLASIGIKHKMEKTLRSAFKAIDFNEKTGVTETDESKEEIRQLIKSLI